MTERWQNELKKLGAVDVPTGRIHARMAQGPSEEPAQGEPGRSPRQRIVAGVVAFAVFAAAGVFAYRILGPLGGSGHPPAVGGLPTLALDVTRVGGVSAAPSSGPSGVDAFNLDVTFGEAHVSVPPTIAGDMPAPRDYPLLGLALTAGAPVSLTSDAATFGLDLTPAAGFGSPDEQPGVRITDGTTLPSPGRYIFGIDAKWANEPGSAEWAYTVDIVPSGTVQIFSPAGNFMVLKPGQVVAPGPVVPDIQMLIDGRLSAGQNTAVGGPYQDQGALRARIVAGASAWVSPNVTRVFDALTARTKSADVAQLIGGSQGEGEIGTIDLTPDDYWFAVSANNNSWKGDIAFPVTVVRGESPSPQPSPSGSGGTLVVKLQTTLASKTGCPGIPDGIASFAGSELKLNGNSFTWNCPNGGPTGAYDIVTPSFPSAKDFLSVPQGTRLLLEGDLTAATGSLLDGTGTYPWPTLQDYGDLIGGVSLQADPGRYVVAITATWPEGTRLFWVPVEIVAPSSATPPPSVAPASEVRISCDGGAPQITDPIVAVQADGLHVRMVGAAPPNEQIAFYGRDDYFLATTGVPTFASGTYTGEFTRPAATGVYDVRCFPKGVDPATINAATTATMVRVVDPNGFWVSTELGCPVDDRGALSVTGGLHPTEEAAVRALSGVVASDTVEPAGYTQDLADRQRYTDYAAWRVVRDGKVVAWTWVNRSNGSWQAVHGVGCVSAGTGHPSTGPSPAPPSSPGL